MTSLMDKFFQHILLLHHQDSQLQKWLCLFLLQEVYPGYVQLSAFPQRLEVLWG
jgi:hypothetical protein